MKQQLKKIIINYPELMSFLKAPVNWFYSAYLTLRYVDTRSEFPAIKINGSVRIKIKKHKTSKLNIKGKLIFEQWLNGDELTAITMSQWSELVIGSDFTLGNGLKIYLGPNSKAVFKGRENESASGITSNSVVMVHKYLEIGKDCIIAWNTFLTDCDWHGIDGRKSYAPTIIGDHVWIGVGVKVLKGAIIKHNTIVSAHSVVLNRNYPNQCLLGGNPARILKEEIPNWHREMHIEDMAFNDNNIS